MKIKNAPNPPNMLPDAMLVQYFETCRKAKMKPAVIHALVDPRGKMLHWSTNTGDVTREMAKLPAGHGCTSKIWPEMS